MRKSLGILFFVLVYSFSLQSQNCTVNAGVDETYCLNDTIILTGFKAGSLSGASTWSQVSGPSAIINSPNALNTGIRGFVPGVYVFNLRSRCTDGSNANDQITITVLNTTKALAGPDKSFCPSGGVMAANSPGAGETGTWSFIDNSGRIILTDDNDPATSYSTMTSNGGISTMRWTISNVNGCSSSDEVTFINYGGVNPVSTQDSIVLSPCYSVFTATGLYGSRSGRGLGGQMAQWTTLRGPNIPTLSGTNTMFSVPVPMAEIH